MHSKRAPVPDGRPSAPALYTPDEFHRIQARLLRLYQSRPGSPDAAALLQEASGRCTCRQWGELERRLRLVARELAGIR
jgi:hypothetical protein